jgi:hypothetical protein
MTFVKIAKIQQDDQFKAACASMGWDGDDWREVWDELAGDVEDRVAYIVNFDAEGAPLINNIKWLHDVDVFVVAHDRWFIINTPALVDTDGNMWVHQHSVN